MNESTDGGFLQWIVGIALMLGTAVVGNLHLRIGRVEQVARESDDAIWAELTAQRNSGQEFRERILREVASKQDIRDLEIRLTELLRQQKH